MELELSAEAKDKKLNRLVAITVVVLSVAAGLGNIKDGNIVQNMSQAQARSLDRWNEYQATRTKLHIVETAQAGLAAGKGTEVLTQFKAEAAKSGEIGYTLGNWKFVTKDSTSNFHQFVFSKWYNSFRCKWNPLL